MEQLVAREDIARVLTIATDERQSPTKPLPDTSSFAPPSTGSADGSELLFSALLCASAYSSASLLSLDEEFIARDYLYRLDK